MQVKLVHNSLIDASKWNSLVEKSNHTKLFNYHWYLTAIDTNWHGLILNDYEIIIPILKKNKIGIPKISNPLFAPQCNAIGDLSNLHIIEKYISRHFFQIHFTSDTLLNLNFTTKTEVVKQVLPLNKSYDEIHASFVGNLKRSIKKANEVLIIKELHNFEELKQALLTYLKFEHINSNSISHLQNLYNLKIDGLTNQIFACYTSDMQLGAISFFMTYKNECVYIKGTATPLGKRLFATPLIINNLINQKSNSDLTLDFGGSNNYNLAKFNKSFGAKDVTYFMYTRNKSNPIKSITNSLKKIWEKK